MKSFKRFERAVQVVQDVRPVLRTEVKVEAPLKAPPTMPDHLAADCALC